PAPAGRESPLQYSGDPLWFWSGSARQKREREERRSSRPYTRGDVPSLQSVAATSRDDCRILWGSVASKQWKPAKFRRLPESRTLRHNISYGNSDRYRCHQSEGNSG